MLEKILIILQVVFGALMTAAILMQAKGATLGEAFGGSNVFYGARRGVEQALFVITIVFAAIFVVLSYVVLFV